MQRTGFIGHRNFQHTVRYTQSVADAVQGLLASAPRPGALCAMPMYHPGVSVEAHHFQRGMICGETAQIHQRLSGIAGNGLPARQGPTQRAPKTSRSVRRRQTAQFRPRRFR